MAERVLRVVFAGDASGALRASKQVQGGLATTQSKFSKFKTGALVAMRGAAIGVGALATGVGYVVKEAGEAQKVTAQTEAVIKSTGGAAGVTAEDMAKLAGSIRDYSGLNDEAVASAGNMLLTFTDIRNEMGKGNAHFDRAARLTADLSVAMKVDLNSAAKMVGKALNDPLKGVTALGRAGVQFSEKQRKMIESLVETGDKAAAQKVIMRELKTQIGGSARAAGDTFPGKLEILRGKLGDVAEKIGNALLPFLTDVADWLLHKAPKAIEELRPLLDSLAKWFRRVGDNVRAFAQFAGDALGVVGDLIGVVSRLNELTDGSVFRGIGDALKHAIPGGGFLSEIGGRASGGPILKNRAVVVGERGPEIVVPNQDARVIPNHQIQGGGPIRNVIQIDSRQIEWSINRKRILLGGV